MTGIQLSVVEAAEEALKKAMLSSQVEELDQLLADELLFTNHLGIVLTKADDLQAHREGWVKIEQLELSETQVILRSSTAVVSVKTHIVGSFMGQPSDALLRFTRVWELREEGGLQVVVGHSCLVSETA